MTNKQYRATNLALLILILSTVSFFLPFSTPVQADRQLPDDADFLAEAAPEAEENPDIPPFMRRKLNKSNYLKSRGKQVLLRRGVEDDPRGTRRTQAIQQMQLQEVMIDRESDFDRITTTEWTPVGPSPVPNGQTMTVTAPVSGRITAIAVHPTNSNIVYVGSAQGGVYRSLDGGASWLGIFDNAMSLAIGAITIAPSNPSTVFVGTGEANLSADSFFGVGVYRIDNADTTPTLVGPLNQDSLAADIFSGRSISKILVHPTDANTIFVSTTSGVGGVSGNAAAVLPTRTIYRSTNALSSNATFTKLNVATVSSGNRTVTDMVLEPGNPQNLICAVYGTNATGDGGIYRTTNALDATPTFTRVLAIGTATLGFRVSLAINKVGSTVTVLAATGETVAGCSTDSGALRRSTDGGVTWSAPIAAANGFCGGQCFYNIALAVNPNDANAIYLGGATTSNCSTIFSRSTNGGSTFARSHVSLHADTHAITLAPSNPAIIYTGNDGGIWKSTDTGATWTSLNNTGLNTIQFQSLSLHPTDREFAVAGTQDNGTLFRQADGTWKRVDYGDGGVALIDRNATNTTNVTIYHTYFNKKSSLIGFGRTTNTSNATDNGWSFLGCGSGSANGISCSDDVLFYAPMALGPGNPNTLYFGTNRLYRSTNQGTTMTVVSQAPLVTGVAISAIGVATQNDNVRLVGLANGKVFATTTGATTLTDITGPIPAKYIASAVIDPNNVNTAYVTLSGFGLADGQHIYKTTNLNAATPTWTAVSYGIPDVPVNTLVVDPANTNILYAGTDIGVYKSTDGGTSWQPFSTGLPRVAVFGMGLQSTHRVLRIATHGRGLWEISVP
jgi:photosystem II stability/assembly factor-like uncharacterized protein